MLDTRPIHNVSGHASQRQITLPSAHFLCHQLSTAPLESAEEKWAVDMFS